MVLENKFHFRIDFSFCPVLSSEACIYWGFNAVNKYNREIALAHGHGQITDAVAGGRRLRSALWLAEEGRAFQGIVAELMAEDAEGAGGVTETTGDFSRRLVIDEEGTERFVLALQGELGGEEEVLVARCSYLIRSAGLHIPIVLQKHFSVNMFG